MLVVCVIKYICYCQSSKGFLLYGNIFQEQNKLCNVFGTKADLVVVFMARILIYAQLSDSLRPSNLCTVLQDPGDPPIYAKISCISET